MKITSNIGIINALIRITLGFTVFAWSTSKLVKQPWRNSYLVMAMLGGMKIGEGILRFCPLTALFNKRQEMMVYNFKMDETN
ncbi:DUF2892 domain-containing protein [Bacillus sp. REN10]|uniref:YgaP family membrane protein n=1 Tax=Bacillus sp. REN10 TaxID=2782541 RepID=UPI00193C4BD9|nr:DUF2892 domain-containing protein [Bacillus sp. REN10]